jgi:hypothetical protein
MTAMLAVKKAPDIDSDTSSGSHDIASYTSSRAFDGVRYMDPAYAVRYKARLRRLLAAMASKNKAKREFAAS